MTSHIAQKKHPGAFKKGLSESVRTDSDPERCHCPYKVGSPEMDAFRIGWNSHYDPAWDKE